MNILILDNYDSFTYNLVHAVDDMGYKQYEVHRNDKIEIEEVEKFDKIIISPGPGLPKESGILMEMLEAYMPSKSILGVCLGHQAIGEVCGGSLKQLETVYHGHSSAIDILVAGYLFDGLQAEIEVGRYHSWVIDQLAEGLTVTARDKSGEIMAIQHDTYDVCGVQFHPESIMTPTGNQIIKNWLENT